MNFSTSKFLVVALLSTSVYCQNILWEKSFGGRHDDHFADAVSTEDGGILLAGSSTSQNNGNKRIDAQGSFDYWIWKMNEKGDEEWQYSFGGAGFDFLKSVKCTRDGGYILGGISNSPKFGGKKDEARGDFDLWVIKLNAGGVEQWQTTIGGSGKDILHEISPTVDGGYIIGGSSSSDASADKIENCYGGLDYWVLKLSATGLIEWQKSFGGIYRDELRTIRQTSDLGYIIGGYSNSPESGNKTEKCEGKGDYWIVKLDRIGQIQWQKVIGGSGDDNLTTLVSTLDNGYIIGGNSNSDVNNKKTASNTRGTDWWLIKLSETGETLWQETYNFGEIDVLTSILKNTDKTFILGGFTKSEKKKARKDSEGINDFIAVKISESGGILWKKIVGSDGDDVLKTLLSTSDGALIFAGTSKQSANNKIHNVNQADSGATTSNDGLKGVASKIDDNLTSFKNDVNSVYSEKTREISDNLQEATGTKEDSRFKIGFVAPNELLGSSPNIGTQDGKGPSSLLTGSEKRKALRGSRNKSLNYGQSDFWIVKFRDERKTSLDVQAVASPNPTTQFTNIEIPFEFDRGTLMIVDISGKVLDSFSINSNQFPVDLSSYAEGIYIIGIKTNKGNASVKIIKTLK